MVRAIQSTVAERRNQTRGSVLVIVMITLLFATFALVAFMEKASVDLLVEQRQVVTRRLRTEAYSALEVTLAVLSEFREAGNGLRSPAEGWSDPLAFAGYTPTDDRVVEVAFDDESGKLSLPRVNAQVLNALFKSWGLSQPDADGLTDALLGWMKQGHVYTSAVQPNYELSAIPYLAPARSIRSFSELAAIEKVREMFFDSSGRPNDYWRRFVDAVSLFDFPRPNLNGARPDTLAALGQFDENQRKNLGEYLRGDGAFGTRGPQYFRSPNEAQQVTGPTGDTAAFGATISALRITITVRDGQTVFRLSTVVAPQGGATTVQTTATAARAETRGSSGQTAGQQQNKPNATQATPPRAGTASGNSGQNAQARNLQYPFTLLEMRENDEIPPPPPSLISPL